MSTRLSYRTVLSSPGAARLLASALYARLPLGMTALSILLVVRSSTGSIAAAGIVVGAYALGNAATAPVQGVLVDRYGQLRVLVPSSVIQASLLITLLLAARSHLATGVLVVIAALAGVALPPFSAAARALWRFVLHEPEQLEAFYSLDAVTQEAIWIVSPLIVSALVAVASPAAALLLCAAISITGGINFCATPASRSWHSDGAARRRGGALASRPLRFLLCSIVSTGCAWGCLTVGLPALAVHLGTARYAGILLALVSVGSLCGGLAYSRRAWVAPLERRYAIALAVIALSALPLCLAGNLRTAAPLAVLLGLGWAPALSCQYALVGRAAPAGSVMEAFTWQTSGFVGGASIGAAIGGALAGAAGPRTVFAVLSASALAAAVIATSARNRINAGART
ncbi:MAG: MFS transporter [Gaiellales bacterium]